MDQMAEMGSRRTGRIKNTAVRDQHRGADRAQRWIQRPAGLQQSAGSSFEFIESVKSRLFSGWEFTFSRKGRIVELPAGASRRWILPMQCILTSATPASARVDRQPYPLSQPLSSGQTVESEIPRRARVPARRGELCRQL